jgi:hypothetical protein
MDGMDERFCWATGLCSINTGNAVVLCLTVATVRP